MLVLISDIVAGRLAAGDGLPRETDLAERFRVSRGVARECIRGLEERGLVAVKHGRGATVRPETEWDMLSPDVLRAVLEIERGAALLGEYLECRRILEISAAGLAAERAGASDLAALSDALERMRATAAWARESPAADDLYHDADIAFHRAVIRAGGNRVLSRMTEPIHQALAAARRPLARPGLRFERSLPEHQRILAAIAAGDPEAARESMRAHLSTVEEYLREYGLERAGAGEARVRV
jgi:GntR family transcriptional repressor for pyruvate dehydrogenase complex